MSRCPFVVGLGVGLPVLLLAAAPARSTLLTFDPVPADNSEVSPIYGDRVRSTSQFGFNYGADFGFTPNVEIDYRPTMRYRETGFGDLTNFIYREDSGNRLLEINLNVDPNYTVRLHYFDLASMLGEALTVEWVAITTGQLDELFRVDWLEVPDIVEERPLPPGETGTPTHLRLHFGPEVSNTRALKIRIMVRNLWDKCDQIGIDNIAFSQSAIPAPGAGAMGVVAMGVLGARRRR